jgi:hypothetical protein
MVPVDRGANSRIKTRPTLAQSVEMHDQDFQGDRRGDGEEPGLLLYDVSVTLPIVAGASALLGAVALTLGSAHRVPWLDVAYFTAIILIVGGVVVYFLVGLWLVPASMIVGGVILFSANQILLYLSASALWCSLPYYLAGAIGIGWGFLHLFPGRNPAPTAR